MTVTEYITAYEEIVSQILDLPEQQYMGFFLKGLKLEMRERVIAFFPTDIMRAMTLARMIEKEVAGGGDVKRHTNSRGFTVKSSGGFGSYSFIKNSYHNLQWVIQHRDQDRFIVHYVRRQ